MRLAHLSLLASAGLLAACGGSQPEQNNLAAADNSAAPLPPTAPSPPLTPIAPPPPAAPLPPANTANAVDANATASDDIPPTPVADTSSSEAAKLAQRFVGLLNGGEYGEAYMLLGSGAPPRSDFDRQFAGISDLHVTMGTPGEPEGAAGSSYLSVPAHLSGTTDGKAVNRSVTIVLRRVNDVPGSTQAQRRWHIDRVDAG